MTATALEIPLAHVDNAPSINALCAALRELHGLAYSFSVRRWDGETRVAAPAGRVSYWFVIRSEAGRLVRPHTADLWPGDTLTAAGHAPVSVAGTGVAFEVIADGTSYPAPAVVHLRDLADFPRGCAAYDGAFRRQPLPPAPSSDSADLRGPNRVNQHTLDMRSDRTPGPTTHYHAPVPVGHGQVVSHSETAILLPRSAYGLPETTDDLRAVMYRRPVEDPTDTVTIPLQVGSILVTPASTDRVMGHRFENAFAMLIAIPGFVSRTTLIH